MLKERKKLPEVITICDSMDESSDADRPGWLPDGWEMVSRCKNNKDISTYYPCPMCEGITLRTQDEVLRHCLFLCEDAASKSQVLIEATPRHPQSVRHRNESRPLKDRQISGSTEKRGQFGSGLFESIPQDWIIEIRRGPREYGKIYKFYVDPKKENRFSSKEEVRFYLEGKPLNYASNKLLSFDTILAEMTFSPDCLPYGWIKELRYRRKCVNGKQKDSYYTDPESGLVFRSLVEVKRYLQTGEVSKHARVPRQTITDMYSFESSAEMPEYIARRLSSSRRTRGICSKRSIDDVGDGGDVEEENKYLMGPTDGVLNAREGFLKDGMEHECYAVVATKSDIVEPNGQFHKRTRPEESGAQTRATVQ
ncbi:hypothetical protein LUZ61_018458 [Rhynchospora tenuis]|uniref:MBD domain-containing protein n=1 Tax=Rhynchospora tenuis TaxID=198213 RepID=A0AAD5Z9K5_9POAL|nr:hypothetical protein LUZ61_018458 [Rhynchospora tenuis]